MQLFLMRHGIAADPDPSRFRSDADRPLTPQGEKRTKEAAEGLIRAGLELESIWTSPFLRARQTAKIVATKIRFQGDGRVTEALLPESWPGAVIDELGRCSASSLLLVGHLPHLDLLLGELLTGTRATVGSFKKAGVACLDYHAGRDPAATLQYFLPPRLLRALGSAAAAAGED